MSDISKKELKVKILNKMNTIVSSIKSSDTLEISQAKSNAMATLSNCYYTIHSADKND